MMTTPSPMLPEIARFVPPGQRWFAGGGCVLELDEFAEVRVGGLLVGRFAKDDIGARNAVLVGLTADGRLPLGQVAAAFGLTAEGLRLIRRRYERDGLVAVVSSRRGGQLKVTDEVRRRLYALFDEGLSVTEATRRVSGLKPRVRRAAVGTVRKEWGAMKAERGAEPVEPVVAGDAKAEEGRVAALEAAPNARVRESEVACMTAEIAGAAADAAVERSSATAVPEAASHRSASTGTAERSSATAVPEAASDGRASNAAVREVAPAGSTSGHGSVTEPAAVSDGSASDARVRESEAARVAAKGPPAGATAERGSATAIPAAAPDESASNARVRESEAARVMAEGAPTGTAVECSATEGPAAVPDGSASKARVRESADVALGEGAVQPAADMSALRIEGTDGASANSPGPNARVRKDVRAEGENDSAARAVEPSAQAAAVVQHAGSWLLLGQLARYPLHEAAREICVSKQLENSAVRLAIDAVAVALAQGESCVEGVRRLATSTVPTLLCCENAPSADWVRRTLHALADVGANELHMSMARRTLALARAETGPAVFFIDNHQRQYTGQEVLRRGWRMQAKRVVPGTTDYYLHNGDGRPLFRMACAAHEPLTEVLLPIADTVRATLGDEQRLLFVFDRAGAYPETMAALRNESFEFVTYERRPYRQLRPTEFVREVVFEREHAEPERLRFAEFHVALGGGRGDVRRVAVLTPEERQYNVLAITSEPAVRVIELMRSRWASQENALKYGVERWSINHLDGRRTLPYSPDTVVPNPARRRLDHELRLARVQEGLARNELAKLEEDDPKRERVLATLEEALRLQQEKLARRATTPKRAPLSETELAGKLVYHGPGYKLVLDTVRIACANAEEDLLEMLAPHLPRPAEAKKALATLFAAPARVSMGARTITVALDPAGTGPEREAYDRFYARVNAAALSLPGDPRRRRLVFGAQDRMDG